MRKFLILSGLLVSVAATGQAQASERAACGNAPRDQWMSTDAVKAKVAALGYDVRRVKEEDGCLEVYAIDKNGAKAELYLNPMSGAIVTSKDRD